MSGHRKQWTENCHEDSVDVTGSVLMARVNKPKMAIGLDEGREVEAIFPPEEEEKILTALRDHSQTRVHVTGRGFFDNSGLLQRITHVDRIDLLPGGEFEYIAGCKPIWEQLAEMSSEIPDEALKAVPQDGAINLDHYLYGCPKDKE